MTVFTTGGSICPKFCVKVRGRLVNVNFIPSVLFGIRGESTFATRDKDLADAIKAHHYFGTYIFVKREIDEAPKVVEEVKSKSIEEELRDPATAVYDDTVTTKGMAVAYIQGNYDDVFTATTVEEMKREAARKWNVYFKNWGK